MKSGKQRRAEITAQRTQRAAKSLALKANLERKKVLTGTAPCSPELLAPYNSYGCPPYVARGYYRDMLFRCISCGKEEVWAATQQKWWYEVAKGNVESTAVRCHLCRRKEQARKAEARRVHIEGLANRGNLIDQR